MLSAKKNVLQNKFKMAVDSKYSNKLYYSRYKDDNRLQRHTTKHVYVRLSLASTKLFLHIAWSRTRNKTCEMMKINIVPDASNAMSSCALSERKKAKNTSFKHTWFFHVDGGWDYVSELWPPTGLQFIPQIIYSMSSHGKMLLTWEKRWTRKKPVPVPFCPPQIHMDWPRPEPGPLRWGAAD
jgi:hypothetical protein